MTKWFVLFLLLAASGLCLAQSESATLSGRVSDPSGASIVGADVVLTNTQTNVEQRSKTNEVGLYVLAGIHPGTYRVAAGAPGFRVLIKEGLTLHVQDELAENFSLTIGAISESMTVTADATPINTTDASVGTVIDRHFVENLPLNGRSFNTLLQLTPGVVITPANNAGGNPGQFSIAGQRTDANNFTLDGVSVNFGVSLGVSGYMGAAGTGSAQAFSAIGGTSSLVSVDALQEFRIETSSFAPEFGRQPGGQVILTTRSGTNDFHGGVFEYFRNDVMDANTWFANQVGKSRAPERHNDFGGFLGGPILKDKTFVFVSYEGARLREPQTTLEQVPSEWARTVAASPTLAPFLNAYPQPDDTTVTPGLYVSAFTGNYSGMATLNAGSVRIDHSFSDKFSIFGRFNEAPSLLASPTLSLSTLQSSEVDTRTLTLGMNMVKSSKISNAVRGNYSTQSANTINSLTSLGGAVPLTPSSLIGSLSTTNTLGEFDFTDTLGRELFSGPAARNHATQMNFTDDLSVTLGTHQLKFGADCRAIFTNTAPPLNITLFLAGRVQDFLSSGQAVLVALSAGKARFLTQSSSLYAQDTWRATPRLAVTYGIRWELDPPPSPRGTTKFAVWENVNNPPQISLAPSGTPLWKTTYGNFAPRIGLAYSLTSNNDFVFRAGGGVFYDLGVGTSANVATTFPNNALLVTPGVTLPATNLVPLLPVISLQPPYTGLIYAFSPDLTLPRSYQWNVALEKSFGGRQAVSATYVGQAGRGLLRQEGLIAPNSNFDPFSSSLFVTQNDASSTYHALQLQYRRPLVSQLQALLNYTWSHSTDNQSDDTDVAISNTIISNKNDRGASSFDVRHSFSAAFTYNVPSVAKSGPLSLITKNWALDSVIVARSGFPFNAIYETLGAIGGALPRPDRIPGQPLWIDAPSAPGGKMLNYNPANNTGAFSVPSTVRQGSEGRNDIPGFGFTQIDLSISRQFPITERLNLQFRADAFNLFNHPNFANPLACIDCGPGNLQSSTMLNQALGGVGGLNSLFQQGGPRSLQLSLRLTF